MLTAVQSLRLACTERGVLGGGWQAHFVRGESCDAHSSPEPAAGEEWI